jgi:hypothetical protein
MYENVFCFVSRGRQGSAVDNAKEKKLPEYVVAVKVIMELVNGIKERDNSIHPQ